MEDILKAIPHRPPFLFVDSIAELTDTKIRTTRKARQDEEFFKGHYPGNPIMPGVLICEAIFQSGAILLSRTMAASGEGVPVLTRISNAKFRSMVKPGDTLEIEAEITEKLSNACFLKGKASVDGKTAVTVEFAVAMAGG
ncbi:MAG: beta-hydroxyacyl-ACP dehydratase [Chloroflexi bacterium RBG_13_60_13]|nr:MAG: beta-hydroxyacyl-ACP dehydratase [Chloroflexi bacterium RBG_13_60_13]